MLALLPARQRGLAPVNTASVARRYKVLLILSVALVLLDQSSKFLAVRLLTPGIAQAHFEAHGEAAPTAARRVELLDSLGLGQQLGYFYGDVVHPCQHPNAYCPVVPLIDGLWSWRYVENPGAAWGVLADTDASIRLPFFYAVAVLAIAFILWFFRRLDDRQVLLTLGLSFVFGGALGNLIDRLHLSYVIDFIDWYAGASHFPTFNVADAAITAGIALLVVDMWRTRPGRNPSASPETT
jgi:signal peptidase II